MGLKRRNGMLAEIGRRDEIAWSRAKSVSPKLCGDLETIQSELERIVYFAAKAQALLARSASHDSNALEYVRLVAASYEDRLSKLGLALIRVVGWCDNMRANAPTNLAGLQEALALLMASRNE